MKRIFVLVLALCLLTGCGWPTAQQSSLPPEPVASETIRAEGVPPYFGVEFLAEENHLQEGTLFCWQEGRMLCLGGEDATTTPDELFWTDSYGQSRTDIPLTLEDGEGIRCMEIGPDGNIYLVLSKQVDVEREDEYAIPYTYQDLRLMVIDGEGGLQTQFSLIAEDAEVNDLAFSPEGGLYLLRCEYDEDAGFFMDHYVDQYSMDGTLLGSLRLADAFPEENRVVSIGFLTTPSGEGLIKLQLNDHEAVYPLSMDKTAYTKPVFEQDDTMGWPQFYEGAGADYYVLDDNLGFVAYSLTEEPKSLFHFEELRSTMPDNASFVAETGEFTYLFSTYLEGTCYFFTVTGQDEPVVEPEKTVLTVGSYGEYVGGSVLQKVTLFNILHPEAELQLKMYSIDEDSEEIYVDKDTAVEALQRDILNGEGPDILIMDNYAFAPGVYSGNGYLTDLAPIMAADSSFSREEYFFNLWETESGIVSYMPIQFGMMSMLTARELTGDGGWTPTEALNIAMETGLAFVDYTGGIKEYLLGDGLADYIEGGTCHFDDGEFAAMLELLKLENPEAQAEGFALRKRLVLGQYLDLSNISELLFAEDHYGDYAIMGLPTPAEEQINVQITNGVGVADTCQNKELAWEFVRLMLDTAGNWFVGFDVSRDSVTTLLNEAMLPEEDENSTLANSGYSVDNEDLAGKPLTQEQADLILSSIEAASPTMVDEDLKAIVAEECEAFFAGDKTAEETAALVQSRAKIFLSERS